MPANFYNYSKKELQKTIFFFKFLAGMELMTSAVQCVIHWATDACPDERNEKIAILVNFVSRPLYVFNMAAFLITRKAQRLRPVSCYISHGNATATLGAASKRPLKNLELHNYLLHQNEYIHDTKTSQEPVTLRSL